jgi:hypothetical protein
MCVSFEVAEHDRRTVLFRQPAQLLVEHGANVETFPINAWLAVLNLVEVMANARSAISGPCSQGDSTCDAVEPVAQSIAIADRPRLPHQDQKRRLKGVLDIPRISKDTAANAQNERTMPLNQSPERALIAPRVKAFQKLSVRYPGRRANLEQPVHLPQDGIAPSLNHGHPLNSHPLLHEARESIQKNLASAAACGARPPGQAHLALRRRRGHHSF